jgi:hypothetical protein
MHTQIEYVVYSLAEDVNVTSFQGPSSFYISFSFLFAAAHHNETRVSSTTQPKGPQVALREREKLVSIAISCDHGDVSFLFCFLTGKIPKGVKKWLNNVRYNVAR